ncbi:MAG: energy transducer TonB [Polyangiaceae bacterium]
MTSATRPTRAVPRALPAWAVAASALGHVLLVAGFGVLALRAFDAKRAAEPSATPPGDGIITIELPGVAEGSLRSDETFDVRGVPPHAAGGDAVARVDDGKSGRGGTGRTPEPAIHLEAKAEPYRYSPDPMSRLDRDQVQRLRTAATRAAWEDRRATAKPMELTFLASGAFERQERRPLAPVDPSRGADEALTAAISGGMLGANSSEPLERADDPVTGAATRGAASASPGKGVDDAKSGAHHTADARVAFGRPDVTRGPTTIPAVTVDRPNDTIDSEQEVAAIVQSQVHASMAGGAAVGQGTGGTLGGGAPGAGGPTGTGSHPRPLGVGSGSWLDLQTDDPALMPYFRKIHGKIEPLWANAFPKSAIIALQQGTVIPEFTVEADGRAHVTWPPIRPSGIDEFDRNCAEAIRKASPFGPIPASLGKTRLVIRAPFVADNPIVK